MKKKGNFRKVVSGLLAGMTMLSTVLSPMTAYAAEIQPEEKPPLYEEVKDLLDVRMLLIYRFHIIDRFVSVRMICRKILILVILCFLKCDFNLVIILDFQSHVI